MSPDRETKRSRPALVFAGLVWCAFLPAPLSFDEAVEAQVVNLEVVVTDPEDRQVVPMRAADGSSAQSAEEVWSPDPA